MPLPECTRLSIGDDRLYVEPVGTGWREIEVLETYFRDMKDVVGPVRDDEIVDLVCIAMSAFTEDRLHADPMVPKETADAAKAKWVVDACADYHRSVYVYRVDGKPAAFISIAFEEKRGYRVDLLAVAESHWDKGIGKALLLYACGQKNISNLWAGTQSTNGPAKRLYESLGMTVVKRERTFHRP